MAVAADRRPAHGAPTDYDTALRTNAVGMYGEAANMLILNALFQDLCVWWSCETRRDVYGVPDFALHRFGKPHFLRLDAKTNHRKYPEVNYLQLDDNDHDDWIYILSYIEKFPTICTVGWCTGKEGKTSDKWALRADRDPQHNTRHDSPLLKPMKLLRPYALQVENGGAL